MSVDAVLPTVPDRSPAQVAYDEQLVAAAKQGDQPAMARLKGTLPGVAVVATPHPNNPKQWTITRAPGAPAATVLWGDGTSSDVAAGVREAHHTYPKGGKFTILVQEPDRSGQAIIEAVAPQTLPASAKKK